MNQERIEQLTGIANQLRSLSIAATTRAGSGHPSSSCSAADLVAALFFGHMRFDPKNAKHPNNDRFILSNGHAAPVLYAAWTELGVLPEADLMKLRELESDVEGHPTPRLPFVDVASGSLGQGLSVGVGLDDIVVEGVAAGASFWIAGLADALPAESVRLFKFARHGERAQTQELLHWFLPLLRFDAGIKFVQLIKLVQERMGLCSARVRPPRLELTGAELADANAVIDQALATRPGVAQTAARG